jgi:hypothetical protein
MLIFLTNYGKLQLYTAIRFISPWDTFKKCIENSFNKAKRFSGTDVY